MARTKTEQFKPLELENPEQAAKTAEAAKLAIQAIRNMAESAVTLIQALIELGLKNEMTPKLAGKTEETTAAPDVTAEEESVTKPEAAESAVSDKPAAGKPGITVDDVTRACVSLIKRNPAVNTQIQALLKSHNAGNGKLSGLDPVHFEDFMRDLEALVGVKNAAE